MKIVWLKLVQQELPKGIGMGERAIALKLYKHVHKYKQTENKHSKTIWIAQWRTQSQDDFLTQGFCVGYQVQLGSHLSSLKHCPTDDCQHDANEGCSKRCHALERPQIPVNSVQFFLVSFSAVVLAFWLSIFILISFTHFCICFEFHVFNQF